MLIKFWADKLAFPLIKPKYIFLFSFTVCSSQFFCSVFLSFKYSCPSNVRKSFPWTFFLLRMMVNFLYLFTDRGRECREGQHPCGPYRAVRDPASLHLQRGRDIQVHQHPRIGRHIPARRQRGWCWNPSFLPSTFSFLLSPNSCLPSPISRFPSPFSPLPSHLFCLPFSHLQTCQKYLMKSLLFCDWRGSAPWDRRLETRVSQFRF